MQKIIAIDGVLANVKSLLRSFDEAGLLNESDMLLGVEWVINRLGIGVMGEESLILEVEDSKAEVPEHFKHLDFIYKCDSKNTTATNTVRYFYGHPTKFTVRDYTKHVCVNKCDIVEEFDEIKREIYIEEKQKVDFYNNKQLLEFSKAVPKDKISEHCPNLFCHSPHKFNFDAENFYFNFESGHVYLKYKKALVDDEGYPMVIDDPYILKAIQDYVAYQALLQIYYNSEADVVQRLGKAEQEHRLSLSEALYNDKLPDYQRFVKFGKLRGANLEIFNLKSQADAVQYKHKRSTTRY
jgi:hypothetical protein